MDRTDRSSSSLHEVDKVSAFAIWGLEPWKAEIISVPNQQLDVLRKLADYKAGKNRSKQTPL